MAELDADVWADLLTEPQRRALAVLAAAADHKWGDRPEPRPVRTSNRTTRLEHVSLTEMCTVHRMVAYQLEAAGLVTFTNLVLETLELTDTGRQLAREAGLC